MQTTGGATPLMYACQQCMEKEVLEILRKQPYAVKDRDRTLKTPLHYCAENPNTSCAEAVLKAAPELVNAQDENGYCTLHLAVIAGNKPLIKLLISKGADVNIHDKEGHSSVHWAIVSSEKEALEMIASAGANPSTPDIHGGYPLHYAVQICGSTCDHFWNFEETIRVVETLLSFGVDVNVKDKDGRQPILWAASAGSADAVIHLVSGGACVEAADKDGLTALHCAASRGHTSTLETLITLCGANVDVIDGNGCSALFYSVTLGHADATELLLQMGADPNRQDRKGRTPAHCGAAKGQLETLRILQKHGGNLWMRNVKGDIPLHEAVASGRKDLVLWLLSQNPEAINLANNDGRCPLHIASMYNNTEMVKVLLDSKSLVNPIMRTSKGILMTPLNVALHKGHRSCGKYLQLHGGVPFSKVSQHSSTFALRVSPSDDMMIAESAGENVMSSQSKISKSRSSTDIQGSQEIVKAESTDKKKVYRRRKKKKTSSTVNDQDSDSNDSVKDLKVKAAESRKSNDESEEKRKVKKVHIETVVVEKESLAKRAEVEHETTRQTEVLEEVTKVTKTKTDSKPLQRNKSFNETKNVSDLTPEDFPPQMQAINQLDVVIMEPDIEVNKSENESVELKPLEATAISLSDEHAAAAAAGSSSDNSAPVGVSGESTSVGLGGDNAADVVLNDENKATEKTKEEDNESEVAVKSTSSNAASNKEEEVRDEQEEVKIEKESAPSSGEKSGRGHGEKKQNGGNKKNETGGKSAGSKTSDEGRKSVGSKSSDEGGKSVGSKSSDEGSTRKSVRSSKGEVKKDSNTVRKTNGGTETVEKHKKAVNSKVSKKSADANEDAEKSETKTENEIKEDEKPKAEPVARNPEITTAENSKIPEESTEADKPETVPTQDEEEKMAHHVTVDLVPAVREANSAAEISAAPENAVEIPVVTENASEISATAENTAEISATAEYASQNSATAEYASQNSATVENAIVENPSPEKEHVEASEVQTSAEEPKITAEVEINHVIVTEDDVEKPSEGKDAGKTDTPQESPVEPEKNEEDSVEILPEAAVEKTPEESEPVGAAEIPVQEIIPHVVEKRSTDFGQTPNENPEVESKPTTAEEQEVDAEKKGDNPTGTNSNEFSRTTASNSSAAHEKGNEDPTKETSESAHEEEVEEPQDKQTASSSEQRHLKNPRVSRLCRRNRDFKDDVNNISVTQLVQNTIRKYHMERGIFYQLLELKRYQIRSGKANEQVLVKRLADEYERSRVFLGMKPFSGLYKFREFEKFLYDQLKVLNTRRSFIIPDVKSYDDIDALSGFLKKSRYRIINEMPQPEMLCTCITQRCHHSACAYTSVPCSAYTVTDLRRQKRYKPKRECFFPRIDQPPPFKSETQKYSERPATLELIQGSEKHVITLPQNSPSKGKRYYVTFTIKGAPAFNEDELEEDPKDFLKHRHSKSV